MASHGYWQEQLSGTDSTSTIVHTCSTEITRTTCARTTASCCAVDGWRAGIVALLWDCTVSDQNISSTVTIFQVSMKWHECRWWWYEWIRYDDWSQDSSLWHEIHHEVHDAVPLAWAPDVVDSLRHAAVVSTLASMVVSNNLDDEPNWCQISYLE